MIEWWEASIKTPPPGGVFFEKLDYRVEVHGMAAVKEALVKANKYGKAHSLPYVDTILKDGNGHKPAPPVIDRKPKHIYR